MKQSKYYKVDDKLCIDTTGFGRKKIKNSSRLDDLSKDDLRK